jgi:hypothetical protein
MTRLGGRSGSGPVFGAPFFSTKVPDDPLMAPRKHAFFFRSCLPFAQLTFFAQSHFLDSGSYLVGPDSAQTFVALVS